MRKLLLLTIILISTASCVTTKPSLYNWDRYTVASYSYYKKQTPESMEVLMKTYETMIKKASGSRKVVAPGVHSEYGYFLIQNGKVQEGIAMLEREKELYPESAVFMDRLIKQFAK